MDCNKWNGDKQRVARGRRGWTNSSQSGLHTLEEREDEQDFGSRHDLPEAKQSSSSSQHSCFISYGKQYSVGQFYIKE